MKEIEVVLSNKIFFKFNGKVVKEMFYGEISQARKIAKMYMQKGYTIKTKRRFFQNRKIKENEEEIKIKVPPRDYQKFIFKIVENNKKYKNGFIVSPTGSGKTNMMAYMIAKRNLSTLIIVPKTILGEQTKKRLIDVLALSSNDVKIINKKLVENIKKDKTKIPSIGIVTWQFIAREKNFKEVYNMGYNQIIVDESHNVTGDKLFNILDNYPSEYKFGFTATYLFSRIQKQDKTKKILGDVIYKLTASDLYEKKALVKPYITFVETGERIGVEETLRGDIWKNKMEKDEKFKWFIVSKMFENFNYLVPVGMTKKDVFYSRDKKIEEKLLFVASELKNMDELTMEQKIGMAKKVLEESPIRRKKVLNFLLEVYSRKNEQGLVVGFSKDFLKYLYSEFKRLGYENVYYITGENKYSFNYVNQENYIIFSTSSLIAEGFDMPSIKKISITTPHYPPFSDATKMIQITGRGVRIANNKEKLELYIFHDEPIEKFIAKKQREAYENLLIEFDAFDTIKKEKISSLNNLTQNKNFFSKNNFNMEKNIMRAKRN